MLAFGFSTGLPLAPPRLPPTPRPPRRPHPSRRASPAAVSSTPESRTGRPRPSDDVSPSRASAPPPAAPRRMPPNALAAETSRYLVESAHDPVRWHPWGAAAFKAARDAQKPILLSSGFLSCHMCDVMNDHFRDPALAALLNDKFVCIKVDREERPDVDSVYNAFVQAVTGRSGWPITCFLTPRLIPFVGTTYLPPDRLMDAVRSIADRWAHNRHKVEDDGVKVLNALRELFTNKHANSAADDDADEDDADADGLGPKMADVIQRAFQAADTCFDVEHGGFGSAPKFPRPAMFEFLLSLHLSATKDDRLKRESLDMVLDSLREMAGGGIHDHVGGGFFRYSLDAAWHVPHFEKILSDQAQLASAYLSAYLITHQPVFKAVACSTLDFIMHELRDAETGIFYSAMHADSPSHYNVDNNAVEGAFYTFSSFELKLMLGEPASSVFHLRYGVEAAGNVSNEAVAKSEYDGLVGLNVLRLCKSVPDIAKELGMSEHQVEQSLQSSLELVRSERARRPRPPLDDLAITCWNALAISAFARAGAALHRADYVDVAVAAADALMTLMVTREDKAADAVFLARAYRGQRGRVEAFSEDYADAIQAFIDCYEVTGKAQYLVFARRLQNALDVDFWVEDGGYANAKRDDDAILIRRKEDYDGSEPSSSSVAALNLVRMASLLGDASLWERARVIAHSFSRVLETSPLAMPLLLVAVQALLTEGSKKVVITGDDDEAATMLDEYWSRGLPRSVVLVRLRPGDKEDQLDKYLSEARKRLWEFGSPEPASGFVCTGETCLEPTRNVGRFGEELDYLRASLAKV